MVNARIRQLIIMGQKAMATDVDFLPITSAELLDISEELLRRREDEVRENAIKSVINMGRVMLTLVIVTGFVAFVVKAIFLLWKAF